jgi:hypothetical protein
MVGESREIFKTSIKGELVPAAADAGGEAHWSLWSNVSRNLIAWFPSEMAAQTRLQSAARKNGADYITSLTLAMVDGSRYTAITGHRLMRRLQDVPD